MQPASTRSDQLKPTQQIQSRDTRDTQPVQPTQTSEEPRQSNLGDPFRNAIPSAQFNNAKSIHTVRSGAPSVINGLLLFCSNLDVNLTRHRWRRVSRNDQFFRNGILL